MFKSNNSFTTSFFGDFAYESVIRRHENHLLVLIKKHVSFEGLNELVDNCYSKDGRYAYEPEMMLKILLVQSLYDLSDREVIERIDTDVIFRWFVGLSLNNEIPHFTRLNTFKERLGQKRFEQIFNLLVKSCRKNNIISDELRIIDTTDQKSKVNLAKLKKMFKKDDDDKTYVDRHSPDKGASFGRKSSGKKSWYGYKAATLVEPKTQIITSLETIPANILDKDMTRPLVEKEEDNIGSAIEDLGGDKGFLSKDTRAVLKERKINDYIIPRRNSKNYLEGKDTIGFYLARHQRSAVERIYADTKRKQGLGKCHYLGLTKTTIQNLLIFFSYNLKRITKVFKVQENIYPTLAPPLLIGKLYPFLANQSKDHPNYKIFPLTCQQGKQFNNNLLNAVS